MLAVALAPVIQLGAVDDARVERGSGCRWPTPRPGPRRSTRADVALDEAGCFAKSASVAARPRPGRTRPRARFMSTSRSPGTPTTTSSRVPSRWVSARTTFLSVSAAVHAPSARGCARWRGRRGSGSSACPESRSTSAARQLSIGMRSGARGERLDVRGVAAGRAHEGVFADRGRVQELLAARSAHRAGIGLHDDVLEAETRRRCARRRRAAPGTRHPAPRPCSRTSRRPSS